MYKSRVNKQQFIVNVTPVHGIIHYTLFNEGQPADQFD